MVSKFLADQRMPQYVDIHAHLADARIRADFARILRQSQEHGLSAVLVCAARREEWAEVARMSEYDGVFGALGVHPFFSEDWDESCLAEIRSRVAPGGRLPAIGEIGLDFQHGRQAAARQRSVFAAQLSLAVELKVPVIVHNRKSWNDFFDLLRAFSGQPPGGVCHHFTGSREVARQALDAGFYLSFCGPLTYRNACRIKDVAGYAPLDRILTETDTPDLPAAKYRGQFSQPWHTAEVVAEIARLKGMTAETVAAAVRENFTRLLRPV